MNKTTVVHCKKDSFDVYIGRPSKWGNPFTHIPSGTKAEFVVANRDEAVARYRDWILGKPELLADLDELRGKVIACWCHPQACHGHVLADLCDNGY